MGFSSEPIFILDRAEIPCEPGIYLLYDENKIVYVGQSTCNIKNRIINEHQRNKRFTGMAWVACDLDSLDGLERLLIKIFRPRFNKAHNPRWFDFRRQEQDYQIRLKQWGIQDYKSSLEYRNLAAKAEEKEIENQALRDEVWELHNFYSECEKQTIPIPYIGGVIHLDGKKVKLQCCHKAHLNIGERPLSNEELRTSQSLPLLINSPFHIQWPSETTTAPSSEVDSKKNSGILQSIKALFRHN